MGCHTWFYNRISEIPNAHLDSYRKKVAKTCRNAYIVKQSFKSWSDDIERELRFYKNRRKDASDEFFIKYLEKAKTRKYYDEKRNEYIKDAEALENLDTPRKEVLRIIAKHESLFNLEDGYYSLSGFGWHDNYRVSGYPEGVFESAEKAIKFLENYDNGNNITYEYKNGMCDEIRDIINNFFEEYPNGYIDYG